MLRLVLCGDVMTGRGIDQILADPADPQLHEPYVRDARQYVQLAEQAHGPIAAPVVPELDAATGELAALRMYPTQLRRMRLCRPSEEDIDWLVDVLNREGRSLGTGVAREADGELALHWEQDA